MNILDVANWDVNQMGQRMEIECDLREEVRQLEDDRVNTCEPPRHYYDIDEDGNIALVCRCGGKRRSVMT